jgi:hypothetical protein
MADRKGRKEPAQTIGTITRPVKQDVIPLRPASITRPKVAQVPTQEQVAERAWALWIRGGCMPGQDHQNWFEAERQLKAELGVK